MKKFDHEERFGKGMGRWYTSWMRKEQEEHEGLGCAKMPLFLSPSFSLSFLLSLSAENRKGKRGEVEGWSMLQGRSVSTTYFSDHPVEFLVRSVSSKSWNYILFYLFETNNWTWLKFNLIMIIIIIITRNELFPILFIEYLITYY